jgi:hypothetical protein
MTIGVMSDGWYAILTGLVLLLLAYLLGRVSWDVDPAATFVAMAFLVLGLWQLARGRLLSGGAGSPARRTLCVASRWAI